MNTTQRVLDWFNAKSRHNRAMERTRFLAARRAENHLWVEHANDYREKDLGYQTIAGQRVRARRVYETKNLKGPSWLVLDDSFAVNPCIA